MTILLDVLVVGVVLLILVVGVILLSLVIRAVLLILTIIGIFATIFFFAGPSFSLPSCTEESAAARVKQLVVRGPASSLNSNTSTKERAASASPLAPVFPLTFVIFCIFIAILLV